ncbi:MAG: glycosyltransferase family 39 protein [Candidatus Promineifilaceae bacterium]|nr:glycosyltransferase family 39 protein [Candidatus Promineifilaceae bacterium]
MRRLRIALSVVALLWLATGLRFYRLDAQSFWNDEGNSARLSERSVSLIVEGTASDVHPPLYYLLLRGWREMVGESEFGLRSLSAFAGVALAAAVYGLGRTLFRRGRSPAWAAALVAAVHPALVYYSQEARMYELLALLAVLSTLLLLRLLPRLAGRWRRAAFLTAGGYALAVAAGLYTHYFFPAVLAVHGAIALLWLVWPGQEKEEDGWLRVAGRWAAVTAVALLFYLPWVPIFMRQVGGRAGDGVGLGAFVADAGRWLALGATIEPGAAVWPLLALAVLLALGLWPGRASGQGFQVAVALGALLLPAVLAVVTGATRPAYFKFLLVSVPFLALLLGRGWAVGWRAARDWGRWRRPLRLALMGVAAVAGWGTARSLHNMYFDPAYARDDYRAIAARIAAEDHPNAGVILDAPNQWEVFTYYHREGAPVYPLPRGNPDGERIDAALREIAERHDRLYAVFWGEAERDPERLVERWLDAHAFKATDEWMGDVRLVTYAVPPEAAMEMERETGLQFGEHITLLGYTLSGDTVRAGDILQLSLFWQTDAPLDVRYKVFLHLVDAQGRLVAQRDSEPGGGLALTTTWAPGERIADNHGLLVPPETPPGRYTLRLGLYELGNSSARLPVALDGGTADAYTVTTVTVQE